MKTLRKIYLAIFFIVILLCRCEEIDKNFNYVLVTVALDVAVFNDRNEQKPVVGESVSMLIQKAGGEKVEGIGTLGSGGITSISGTFKLFKEQPIVVSAFLVSNSEKSSSGTLTWEQVDLMATDQKDGPRTYSWTPTLEIYLNK
jgi:hypothetical protein